MRRAFLKKAGVRVRRLNNGDQMCRFAYAVRDPAFRLRGCVIDESSDRRRH